MNKIKEAIKEFWRRQKLFWILPLIGVVWLLLTNSELLAMTIKVVLIGYAAIGLAYFARKTLIKTDLGDHLEAAQQGNMASGLVVLAISIFYCVIVWIFAHAILN